MELITLDVISPSVLVAIGILLIASEVFIFSFTLFWFGIASIIVAILSNYVVFTDGMWQIANISILALVLLFILRSKTLKIFLKSKDKEVNDTFLNDAGYGKIKNNKVYFKATYWNIEPNQEQFKENDDVKVISTSHGYAKIEKLKNN